MSQQAMVIAGVSFLMPLIVAMVAKVSWDSRQKDFAMFALCIVAAIIANLPETISTNMMPYVNVMIKYAGSILLTSKLIYYLMRQVGLTSGLMDWIIENLGNVE